jgi:hypothetical protein
LAVFGPGWPFVGAAPPFATAAVPVFFPPGLTAVFAAVFAAPPDFAADFTAGALAFVAALSAAAFALAALAASALAFAAAALAFASAAFVFVRDAFTVYFLLFQKRTSTAFGYCIERQAIQP